MRFESRQEAYFYTVYLLSNMLEKNKDSKAEIVSVIESIKILIENHEQSPLRIAGLIDAIQVKALEDRVRLRILSSALKNPNSFLKVSNLQKYENGVARRLESELHIEMLINPTEKMMLAVGKISQKMIPVITSLDDSHNFFNMLVCADKLCLTFGAYQKKPSKNDVTALLQANSPRQLLEILFIHIAFATFVARDENVMEKGAKIALKVSNERMYYSALYVDRGRLGKIGRLRTSTMGIATFDEGIVSVGLPKHSSRWVADSKAQGADFDSWFVKALIEKDTPYVAGVSGMISVFMGCMLSLDILTTDEEKRLYFLSTASYIVAGGFHSLHEVIAPVVYCLPELNLVPGYEVAIADENNPFIPAPCYHTFYALMAKHDDELEKRRNNAWEKACIFFCEHYIATTKLKKYDELMEKNIILDVVSGFQKTEKNSFFGPPPAISLFLDKFKNAVAFADTFEQAQVVFVAFFQKLSENSHEKLFLNLEERLAESLGFVSVAEFQRFFLMKGSAPAQEEILLIDPEKGPSLLPPLAPRNASFSE